MERAILSLSPANIFTIWIMLALLYLGAVGITMLLIGAGSAQAG